MGASNNSHLYPPLVLKFEVMHPKIAKLSIYLKTFKKSIKILRWKNITYEIQVTFGTSYILFEQ